MTERVGIWALIQAAGYAALSINSRLLFWLNIKEFWSKELGKQLATLSFLKVKSSFNS